MATFKVEQTGKEEKLKVDGSELPNDHDADVQIIFVEENNDHLKRRLGNRQIQLIA